MKHPSSRAVCLPIAWGDGMSSEPRRKGVRKQIGLALVATLAAACAGPIDAPSPSAVDSATLQSELGSDSAGASAAQGSALPTLEQDAILRAGRALLEERNQQLVFDAAKVTAQARLKVSERILPRIERESAALHERAARLAELGERYSGFQTDVKVIEAKKVGDKILARVRESTRLDYVKVRGDEPPFTAFEVDRELTFSRENGELVIEGIQLANPGGLAPINEVTRAAQPAVDDALAVSPFAPPSSAALEKKPLRTLGQKLKTLQAIAPLAYSYNAMANYATTYALSYNSAYRSFSSDCTNFISQAMTAGGWAMVSGWYQSNSVWWYNFLNQSYTWAGAHNWYFFATGSGRTSLLSNVWYMDLADVLQMDFQGDYVIDHSMIVTFVGSNDLYLSYHTTNTLNRSLSSIIAQYPSALYWAHRT
jgi:hypothetical protein